MPGKPDFTGNQNISEQTLGKVQTDAEITANSANQYDNDVTNYDLVADGDYVSSEVNISGAIELVLKGKSEYNCNVLVEWTDGNGNVTYTESVSASTDVTDFNLLYPTGSTHVQIRVTDTSGQTQNKLNMTVNAH